MNSDKQLIKVTNQWFVLLLLTLGTASLFFFWPKIAVSNIGPIEFSQNLADFNTNISKHPDEIRPNTYYDFAFILVYTILFYFAYRVFQRSMRIPVSKLWIILCLLPGIFDVIENVLLLSLLSHSDSNWMFNLFWFTVRAKWTLVIPFIIINFTILIYYLIRFINSFIRS